MKNKLNKEIINEKISKIETLLKEIKESEQIESDGDEIKEDTNKPEQDTESDEDDENLEENKNVEEEDTESDDEPEEIIEEETQITKSAFSNPWFYVGMIGVIIIIIFFYKIVIFNPSNNPALLGNNGQYDEFAKYLTAQGVKMYGTEWCPHCKTQKALFGDSFQYIDYIDCDKESKACLDANINGFPTWNINNQNYPGVQPLEELAKLTNYGGKI